MRIALAAFFFALLTGCTSCQREQLGMHVDPDLASLAPVSTPAMAGADIAKLKSSQLYQQHASQLNIPLLNAAAKHIGIDPRTDLTSVLVFFADNHPVTVAHGTFSNDTVQSKLTDLGAHHTTYHGKLLLTNSDGAVTFPAASTVEASKTDALHAMLDRNTKLGVYAALRTRLKSIPASYQMWFVSEGRLPMMGMSPDSNIGSAVSNIASLVNGTAIGVGADTGLHLYGTLNCVSDKGAEQVRDAMRGMLAIARLTTRDDEPDLLQIYSAVHIESNASTVQIKADLSPDLSEKLFTHIAGLQSRAGQILAK